MENRFARKGVIFAAIAFVTALAVPILNASRDAFAGRISTDGFHFVLGTLLGISLAFLGATVSGIARATGAKSGPTPQ
jgi:hypothetical protein